MPYGPYGKGDVRRAVGCCLTAMDGGISKLPCGPLVAVGAICCVRAFGDGFLARIADTLETLSCTKQPAWIAAWQL